MKVISDIDEMRALSMSLRLGLKRIGFVPTMGALHAGHLALIERAHAKSDVTVASVYVNPTQFGPGEDFLRYPRDLQHDLAKLDEAGCDVVFTPTDEQLYPDGSSTFTSVIGKLTSSYEGAIRPDHFRGVTTIVAKLFNIVDPQVAVFGRKDAQQVAVIRRMISDLQYDIHLSVLDTVRDADGLAMSSRNAYLNPQHRSDATSLYRALLAAKECVDSGATADAVRNVLRTTVSQGIELDYADVVNERTFEPTNDVSTHPLAIIAGRCFGTRLIDNLPL